MEAVPIDDRGLLLGDGLFETVLAVSGRLVRFDQHAARLTRGCVTLGLPTPEAGALKAAADAALVSAGLTQMRAAVRLTWTAGSGGRGLERPVSPSPRLVASAAPAPVSIGPASLATVTVRRNPSSPTSRLKTLAYLDNIEARREARGMGADEALMLNTAGQIACAAAANIFWIHDGQIHTPALDCGVLDGIVRSQVLDAASQLGVTMMEAHEGWAALESADTVFFTNSLIGIRAVNRIDGRDYRAHPLVERLAGVIEAEV